MPNFGRILRNPVTAEADPSNITTGGLVSASFERAYRDNPAWHALNGMFEDSGRIMPQAEARRFYESRGLDPDDFDTDGVGRLEAERNVFLHERNKALDAIIDAGESRSATNYIASLGASFGAGVVEPTNILAAAVPLGATARLAVAGRSLAGRALARTAVAGREAAVLGALQQPLVAEGRSQIGEDYTAADFIMNVGADALTGGILSAGGGFIGDTIQIRTKGGVTVPEVNPIGFRKRLKFVRNKRRLRNEVLEQGWREDAPAYQVDNIQEIINVAAMSRSVGNMDGIDDVFATHLVKKRAEALRKVDDMERVGGITTEQSNVLRDHLNDPSAPVRIEIRDGEIRLDKKRSLQDIPPAALQGVVGRQLASDLMREGEEKAFRNLAKRVLDRDMSAIADFSRITGEDVPKSLVDILEERSPRTVADAIEGRLSRFDTPDDDIRALARKMRDEGYLDADLDGDDLVREMRRAIKRDVNGSPVYSEKDIAARQDQINRLRELENETRGKQISEMRRVERELNERPGEFAKDVTNRHGRQQVDEGELARLRQEIQEAQDNPLAEVDDLDELVAGLDLDPDTRAAYQAASDEAAAFTTASDTAIDFIINCRLKGS